jgi:hypothetical protein
MDSKQFAGLYVKTMRREERKTIGHGPHSNVRGTSWALTDAVLQLIGEALEARRINFLPLQKTGVVVGRRQQYWMPFLFFEKLHENFDQALNVGWEMLVRR